MLRIKNIGVEVELGAGHGSAFAGERGGMSVLPLDLAGFPATVLVQLTFFAQARNFIGLILAHLTGLIGVQRDLDVGDPPRVFCCGGRLVVFVSYLIHVTGLKIQYL